MTVKNFNMPTPSKSSFYLHHFLKERERERERESAQAFVNDAKNEGKKD